jgi:PAS domain S-box-containing protein
MAYNEFYEQEKRGWRLSFLKLIVFSVASLLSLLIIVRTLINGKFLLADLILFILIVTYTGLYFVAVRRSLDIAAGILVAVSTILISFLAFNASGVYDSAIYAYMAIMIISYLLTGWRYSLIVLLFTIAWLWILGYLSMSGTYIFDEVDSIPNFLIDISVVLILVSALSHYYLSRINRYVERISQELSERKTAEQNYRNLFEQAAEGILIVDTAGIILLANESICKISGYSKEELLSNNVACLFSEDELIKEPFRYDLLEKDQVVSRVRYITKKDRSGLPVEMRTKKLNDGRYQSFIADISERLKAEKLLKDFERIFNLSANPICILDISGNFIKVNPAMVRILEYDYHEIEGNNMTAFIFPDDRDTARRYCESILQRHNEIFNYENRYFTKSGRLVWFSWTTQPIYNDNISFSIAHDITSLKRIEDELIKARDQAKASDRLKTAFLMNMSHEIRTPMNGIMGFSEMLLNEKMNEEEKAYYLNLVMQNSHKLLALVDAILDISEIETGQIELHFENVNIAGLTNEIYDEFFPMTQSAGLRFKLTHPGGDDLVVWTDIKRLRQVLTNLLSNAIKFTHSGSLSVKYKLENDFIEFAVQDSGIGIDPSLHEIIFERFRQAEMNLSRDYGGTGLGLALSKELVQLLGGSIRIESLPKKGSTFFFTIPAKNK